MASKSTMVKCNCARCNTHLYTCLNQWAKASKSYFMPSIPGTAESDLEQQAEEVPGPRESMLAGCKVQQLKCGACFIILGVKCSTVTPEGHPELQNACFFRLSRVTLKTPITATVVGPNVTENLQDLSQADSLLQAMATAHREASGTPEGGDEVGDGVSESSHGLTSIRDLLDSQRKDIDRIEAKLDLFQQNTKKALAGLERLQHQRAAATRKPPDYSEEVDALIENVSRISGKANEVDGLKLEMLAMKRRIKQLEENMGSQSTHTFGAPTPEPPHGVQYGERTSSGRRTSNNDNPLTSGPSRSHNQDDFTRESGRDNSDNQFTVLENFDIEQRQSTSRTADSMPASSQIRLNPRNSLVGAGVVFDSEDEGHRLGSPSQMSPHTRDPQPHGFLQTTPSMRPRGRGNGRGRGRGRGRGGVRMSLEEHDSTPPWEVDNYSSAVGNVTSTSTRGRTIIRRGISSGELRFNSPPNKRRKTTLPTERTRDAEGHLLRADGSIDRRSGNRRGGKLGARVSTNQADHQAAPNATTAPPQADQSHLELMQQIYPNRAGRTLREAISGALENGNAAGPPSAEATAHLDVNPANGRASEFAAVVQETGAGPGESQWTVGTGSQYVPDTTTETGGKTEYLSTAGTTTTTTTGTTVASNEFESSYASRNASEDSTFRTQA